MLLLDVLVPTLVPMNTFRAVSFGSTTDIDVTLSLSTKLLWLSSPIIGAFEFRTFVGNRDVDGDERDEENDDEGDDDDDDDDVDDVVVSEAVCCTPRYVCCGVDVYVGV